MVFLVTYDLKVPNDTPGNYELIIGAIKSQFPIWCHIEKSVWLVESIDSAATIRDSLKAYLHPGDLMFVAPLMRGWASWNFGTERNDWLKGRSF
jgi:hypothetical protein